MSVASETLSISLDNFGNDEDLLNILLRYGLFIGAIFQLICIICTILMPDNDDCSHTDSLEETVRTTADNPLNNVRRIHKLRKQEKKKRR